MNTSRAGSNMPCSRIQRRRARATSAHSVADERVQAIRSDVNLGPAGARNLAIAHSSGDLLAFLDADDLWEPTYLERQLGVLIALARELASLRRTEGRSQSYFCMNFFIAFLQNIFARGNFRERLR